MMNMLVFQGEATSEREASPVENLNFQILWSFQNILSNNSKPGLFRWLSFPSLQLILGTV